VFTIFSVWQVLFSQFSTACCQNVVGKRLLNMPELKTLLERSVLRGETSIKSDLKEIGCDYLLQHRVQWLCFRHGNGPLLFMTRTRYTTVIFQKGFKSVVVGYNTKNFRDKLSFSDSGPDLQVSESVYSAESYRGN
jgi:hypothetical protein